MGVSGQGEGEFESRGSFYSPVRSTSPGVRGCREFKPEKKKTEKKKKEKKTPHIPTSRDQSLRSSNPGRTGGRGFVLEFKRFPPPLTASSS